MKIIIPVVAQTGAKSSIANSFHNTELACIYDSSNHTCEWIATKSMIREGTLALALEQNEIRAVISKNMPLMALGFFTDSGITVYKAENASIEDNIELFTARKLKIMTNASVKSEPDCSGSCSSCHTTCKS